MLSVRKTDNFDIEPEPPPATFGTKQVAFGVFYGLLMYSAVCAVVYLLLWLLH